MKRINWNTVRLVVMLGVVVFLYSFAGARNDNRKLGKTEVEIEGSEHFITKDIVNKLLIQNFGAVSNVKKVQINLNKVEKSICQNPMVEKAEVYTTIDGKLVAKISQRKPVGRVFSGALSYYLDSKGREMPLSDSETARVPLVMGEVKKADPKKLEKLLDYIYDDAFLSKNITGMTVTPVGNVVMTSRAYDYEILFGQPVNIDRKFKNYKAFLQYAVKDTLIENYKTINLKFTQQVVCTKK